MSEEVGGFVLLSERQWEKTSRVIKRQLVRAVEPRTKIKKKVLGWDSVHKEKGSTRVE